MTKTPVLPGVWWVDIPEEGLKILCGTPMDSVKHLMNQMLINKIEEYGHAYYSGPNALLLSDILVQNGHLWNLVEFPVLHMLYRQGMMFPKHPGNTGQKPMLIGLSENMDGIVNYIQRGFYGLSSRDEIRMSGISEEDSEHWWRLKLQFADGKIQDRENILDIVRLNRQGGKIAKNLKIERLGINRYRFTTPADTLEIDMNLPEQIDWYPAYDLPYTQVDTSGFSIVHIGGGNGWNPNRPCMGSLINYYGRHYLVDTGPGIAYSLEHLGMSINEIDAVFLTHVHDDHFAGITDLTRRDKPLTVYAVQPVIDTLRYKLKSLLGCDSEYFDQMITIHYLTIDAWNDINGLKVMPTFSPHPIESTIIFFRSQFGDGYKTYGHLADIISRTVLDGFLKGDEVYAAFMEKAYSNYFRHCDVKKIDVGGGLIHGQIKDFKDDTSTKIILDHLEGQAHKKYLQYGTEVDFGDVDILIPSHENSNDFYINNSLQQDFPFFGEKELKHIKSCSIECYPPDVNLSENGILSENLLLMLSGIVQRDPKDTLTSLRLTPGGLVGEEEYLFHESSHPIYITRTYIRALCISTHLYTELLESANYLQTRLRHLEIRRFLYALNFPGQKVSCPGLDRLCEEVEDKLFKQGQRIITGRKSMDAIYLLCSGSMINIKTSQYLLPGEWLNINRVLTENQEASQNIWTVTEDSRFIILPGPAIRKIPSLNWILRELRLRL